MIAAIMQPYFFPYIGYFQLMRAVDTFVFLDDVQYIDRGWVNRNRIRQSGSATWLTVPVRNARREVPINCREYLLADGETIRKVKQRLRDSYKKAPAYPETFSLLSRLLEFDDANVAAFNTHLLMEIAQTFRIGCRFLLSSELGKAPGQKGEARIIDLCRRIGASHYVNPIGGAGLYDPAGFTASGIRLFFLRTTAAPTALAEGPQHLSIIDMLMHDGVSGCVDRLAQYELLAPGNPSLEV